MSQTNVNLPPLAPGSIALRFRVEWRGQPAHPICIGVQAVGVVRVDGDRVTWTNARAKRGGAVYQHTSDRRELIAVEALENIDGDFLQSLVAEAFPEPDGTAKAEEPALTAERGAVPVSSARPWYQRDLDEPTEAVA